MSAVAGELINLSIHYAEDYGFTEPVVLKAAHESYLWMHTPVLALHEMGIKQVVPPGGDAGMACRFW